MRTILALMIVATLAACSPAEETSQGDHKAAMINALVHSYKLQGKTVVAVEIPDDEYDALGELPDGEEWVFESEDAGDIEIRARTSRKNPVVFEGDE